MASPCWLKTPRSDPRFTPKVDELTHTETRSIVCVPIKAHDHVLGVIELVNALGKPSFGTEDIPILKSLADYAAIALENARYVQRIHELTITDDCTALYNARHLNFVLDTEIYRSNRYGYEFSVIFIDLDHFKQVNDVHGHLVGSKLLWMIGDSIKAPPAHDRLRFPLRRRRVRGSASPDLQGKCLDGRAPHPRTADQSCLLSRKRK